MRHIAIIAALALGALACGKEADKTQPAPAEPAATGAKTAPTEPAAGATGAAAAPDPAAPTGEPATDAAAGAAPAPAEGATAGGAAADVAPEAAAAPEVPTAEDFEEKASADVDKKNLEAEVSKMEKELGAKSGKK